MALIFSLRPCIFCSIERGGFLVMCDTRIGEPGFSVTNNPTWAARQVNKCHFTYVTTHFPTLPSLYLRHSAFSNPSVASPTSQQFNAYSTDFLGVKMHPTAAAHESYFFFPFFLFLNFRTLGMNEVLQS